MRARVARASRRASTRASCLPCLLRDAELLHALGVNLNLIGQVSERLPRVAILTVASTVDELHVLHAHSPCCHEHLDAREGEGR